MTACHSAEVLGPGPEVPESFDAYRDTLMMELARTWNTYAPLVDAAIAPPA